jgi:hypothetical protein
MIPEAARPRIEAATARTSFDVDVDEADSAAALAYIATAEGTAATIAERACDRFGFDYARCPAEILAAAEDRAIESARTFLLEQVAAIAAAWGAYNTAAAPFDAEKKVVAAKVAAAKAARAPYDGLQNAWDHLEAIRNGFAHIRNDAVQAAEDALQARFGAASWDGRDQGHFPRGWRP